MAGEDQDAEKTEEATQTRREDFRKRGQVAQSRELASALFVLFGVGLIAAFGPFFFQQVQDIFRHTYGADLVAAVRSGDLLPAASFAMKKMVLLLLPIAGITLLIGIGSTVVQVGFLNVEDALTPKWEKLDPVEGLKRLFSLRNLFEGIKAILKIVVIGVVVYFSMRSQLLKLPMISQMDVNQIFVYLSDLVVRVLFAVGLSLLTVALVDYFFQRWELEKRMMMTKQEVKEEHKSREGDPLIKARIRRVQKEMSQRRMMEKVPSASVIVTNPTHIAVALKYTADLPAPQLIAKGGDLIAEKIKEIAKQHSIPIVENKPLARTIFKTMKIGQVIPRELFVAVAEVLSYVFKLKKKRKI